MMNILILGATSAIAQEIAKLYATSNNKLLLCGRNEGNLNAVMDDLNVRGANASCFVADLADSEAQNTLMNHVHEKFENIDIAIIAYGTLPKQKEIQDDPKMIQNELQTNCNSVISLLTLLVNKMEAQRYGSICVLSSVAGDRGRQSNYIYGAAKACVSTYLQGLRNRLHGSSINILTVKLGFVDTPMTQNFKKGLLWVKPNLVAKQIVKSIETKKQSIYVPFFWRYIMLLIKSIPEAVFKKLSL